MRLPTLALTIHWKVAMRASSGLHQALAWSEFKGLLVYLDFLYSSFQDLFSCVLRFDPMWNVARIQPWPSPSVKPPLCTPQSSPGATMLCTSRSERHSVQIVLVRLNTETGLRPPKRGRVGVSLLLAVAPRRFGDPFGSKRELGQVPRSRERRPRGLPRDSRPPGVGRR